MPIRTCILAAPCLVAALAASASAAPLLYDVAASESNTRLSAVVSASLDASPDLTEGTINGESGQLPQTAATVIGTDTKPANSSSLVADVGIPGGFDAGANGITFSELSIDFQNVPGPVGNFTFGTSLAGLGIVPGDGLIPGLPFGVGETPILIFAANVEFASLSIVLNAPFSSALTENPASPGEYQWTGPADVTLTGEFKPSIDVSPQNLDPIPFSIPVAAFPLVGSFSGDRDGSEIVVGLDADGLDDLVENQDLSPDPISYEIEVPVSALGLEEALGDLITALQLQAIHDLLGESVLVNFSLAEVLAFDANLFEVHYTNATPVPEPGTAALLGLGFAVLGAVRRNRIRRD